MCMYIPPFLAFIDYLLTVFVVLCSLVSIFLYWTRQWTMTLRHGHYKICLLMHCCVFMRTMPFYTSTKKDRGSSTSTISRWSNLPDEVAWGKGIQLYCVSYWQVLKPTWHTIHRWAFASRMLYIFICKETLTAGQSSLRGFWDKEISVWPTRQMLYYHLRPNFFSICLVRTNEYLLLSESRDGP